jgi:purine-nucleoside phosphorylase
MLPLAAQIDETTRFIRRHWRGQARAGIVLGSGLGSLAEAIDVEASIPFGEIPNFVASTAAGHDGRIVFGKLGRVPLVAMVGRAHCYEGHSAATVAFPIRVMKSLGAGVLVVTNAAGAVNEEFSVGDLMIIDDHINQMFRNPLVGINDDALGPRFPDMSAPYDGQLVETVLEIARREHIACRRGVYVGMLGPSYETRAEYRFLRQIGGDVVGMSTVPEVVVAAHAGLRVLGISIVTNVFREGEAPTTSHEEVVATAKSASDKLKRLIRNVLRRIFEKG